MPLSNDQLSEIVTELVRRPGHEMVRHLTADLLQQGLGAPLSDLFFEHRLPEVHGRADALLGRTIFEFKSNLRRERRDAEEELARYLAQRERETGDRYVGIATDGAEFVSYSLSEGNLVSLTSFAPSRERPRLILRLLDSIVALQAELIPDPEVIRQYLGRDSALYESARIILVHQWKEVQNHPDVLLKRELWDRFLQTVYGSSVNEDELFFQHTYLTVVAKAMATLVLGVGLPDAADLLAGRPFENAGIFGAVESDFFDWILAGSRGRDLVESISQQVGRFRLGGADIRHDVLKGLYETLIDPEQRHELGEYYTPDWLAAKMCERVISDSLETRVLDPACGSGTFLFHSVRQFFAAGDGAGLSNHEVIAKCTEYVRGIDVHPVAVIIARVTYLLGIGAERIRSSDRPGTLSIPVYLGDSLQWNTERLMAQRNVVIEVPDVEGGSVIPPLTFPWMIASDPSQFDAVISKLLDLSEQGATQEAARQWLSRNGIRDETDLGTLQRTYQSLNQLQAERRDHIWGYVARNLIRPLWLSSEGQLSDVVIGNPPWLVYRHMTSAIRNRFRDESQARNLWVGGRLAAHQDLSAYFFARCSELYLKPGGSIAFVMPLAAVRGRQHEAFREGRFAQTFLKFEEVWTLDERVQPLFPMPASVFLAKPMAIEMHTLESSGRPRSVQSFAGLLPRRDATLGEADAVLRVEERPWPPAVEEFASPYAAEFREGATLNPRIAYVVERIPAGPFGHNPAAPAVRSDRAAQEKEPWRSLPAIEGNVEIEFVRKVLYGESVAPYRILGPVEAVVPWEGRTEILLDSESALESGFLGLAEWLRQAEELWEKHGRGRMTLLDRLNYQGGLTSQFPTQGLRVVYSASGKLPAAAVVRDSSLLVNNYLYWAAIASDDEGHYLTAILNSETVRALVAPVQARGQWGERHIHKLVFTLPIPRFDAEVSLHRHLAAIGRSAEEAATRLEVPTDMHFITARRRVRQALRDVGVAEEIDMQVAELLELRPDVTVRSLDS